jgi:hypothetical protein
MVEDRECCTAVVMFLCFKCPLFDMIIIGSCWLGILKTWVGPGKATQQSEANQVGVTDHHGKNDTNWPLTIIRIITGSEGDNKGRNMWHYVSWGL